MTGARRSAPVTDVGWSPAGTQVSVVMATRGVEILDVRTGYAPAAVSLVAVRSKPSPGRRMAAR